MDSTAQDEIQKLKKTIDKQGQTLARLRKISNANISNNEFNRTLDRYEKSEQELLTKEADLIKEVAELKQEIKELLDIISNN